MAATGAAGCAGVAAGGAGGVAAGVAGAAAGGGVGFSAAFGVPSLEGAALDGAELDGAESEGSEPLEGAGLEGEEPELLAALLAGAAEPPLLLAGVELEGPLLCGAGRDELLAPAPDCWNGSGSAGELQPASATRGRRRGTNHDERYSMS
ncbi:MAG TPA: hypothetical protein VFS67_04000 [Polyangiaceae bacterium]|nr:hypothetical protein [Polyangiaceae bacterium]